ncbi:hypothetical protein Tsubulata_028231, partial [Turnera subulata]
DLHQLSYLSSGSTSGRGVKFVSSVTQELLTAATKLGIWKVWSGMQWPTTELVESELRSRRGSELLVIRDRGVKLCFASSPR